MAVMAQHSVDSTDMAGALWTLGGHLGFPFEEQGVERGPGRYLGARPHLGSCGSQHHPSPTNTPGSLHARHPHTSLPGTTSRPLKSLRSHGTGSALAVPRDRNQVREAEEKKVRKEGNSSWSPARHSEVTLNRSLLPLDLSFLVCQPGRVAPPSTTSGLL